VDASLILSLLLAGAIGFMLGIFGGGGSILTVPVLVYVTHVSPAAAVGMSLAIVGTTSLVASHAHARQGGVHTPTALLFGGAGMLTAFLGARLTHYVSGRTLMLAFASLLLFVGAWMLFGRQTVSTKPARPRRLLRALLAGLVVGGLTGFLGVGGGFLVVPALIAFAGLEMREAIGTSLLVIAINSAAGFVGHLSSDGFDLVLAAELALVAVLGALIGERTLRGVSVVGLRRGFAVFVIAVGTLVASVSAQARSLAEKNLSRPAGSRVPASCALEPNYSVRSGPGTASSPR